jgi:nucleoside phosphorylase
MTSKSSLTGWGLAVGAALGAALGIAAGHVGAWLAIGVAIGMMLGTSFRKKAPDCPECAVAHKRHQEQMQNLTTNR